MKYTNRNEGIIIASYNKNNKIKSFTTANKDIIKTKKLQININLIFFQYNLVSNARNEIIPTI
jgi:hypothetical protein